MSTLQTPVQGHFCPPPTLEPGKRIGGLSERKLRFHARTPEKSSGMWEYKEGRGGKNRRGGGGKETMMSCSNESTTTTTTTLHRANGRVKGFTVCCMHVFWQLRTLELQDVESSCKFNRLSCSQEKCNLPKKMIQISR